MTLDIHNDLKQLAKDIETYKKNCKDNEDVMKSVYADLEYIMMGVEK